MLLAPLQVPSQRLDAPSITSVSRVKPGALPRSPEENTEKSRLGNRLMNVVIPVFALIGVPYFKIRSVESHREKGGGSKGRMGGKVQVVPWSKKKKKKKLPSSLDDLGASCSEAVQHVRSEEHALSLCLLRGITLNICVTCRESRDTGSISSPSPSTRVETSDS